MAEGTPQGCQEPDCDAGVYARGWCARHYKRWQRTGSADRAARPTTCAVDGCGEPVDARGWCHGHYQRWRRHGDVDADTPLWDRARPTCSVDDCGESTQAQGLCGTHYQRFRKHGTAQEEVPVRSPGRDGHLSHGYRKVSVPAEYQHLTNGETSVLEHRLVMAVHLGRPLEPGENVHHRNGNRLDNRLENLELWSTTQPRGQRVEDKVTYAVRILRRYAPGMLAGPADS